MILTLLKHSIYETCIDVVFENLLTNFNSIPITKFTSIDDFYVGQQFNSIDVIGQGRRLTNPIVISINKCDVRGYIDVRDDLGNRYAINSDDIHRLRFYL
jgi:hypothetical protein